ncbi:MAG: hypothetical protein ACODAQ_07275 [Phycisphaeraceae bacterium]
MPIDRKHRANRQSAISNWQFAPLLWACCFLALCATPRTLFAQADQLDQGLFIDALAEEGMSELLLHMVETEPPDDPVVARQVEIAQHRMRYNDENRPLEERHEALRSAIDATRQLISEFDGHRQRPIWQTDLAELRLTEQLQALFNQANLFYEFGVPTPEQRDIFTDAVIESLEATSSADFRLFQLRGEIGRDEGLANELRNTGVFTRLFEEYAEQRTPFFLAHAAYYTTLLPDTHDYFASLGDRANPDVPEQASTIERERARLLDQAIEKLEPFVNDESDMIGVRRLAMSLTGRAQVAQGNTSEGVALLEQVVEAESGDRTALIAQLAHAMALHHTDDHGGALDVIAAVEGHSLPADNPLYRLLVTDTEHRIRLARAEQQEDGDAREQAIAAAYEPYMRLLDSAGGDALRQYVYRRWERTIQDDDDLASRPPVVRLGIAQMARQEGQRAVQQASGEPPQQALDQLNRAVRLCSALREEDLSDAVRASAMFNQAVAQYWLAPQQVGNRLTVAQLMTDLADRYPDQPRAGDAIATAVGLLRSLHQMQGRPSEVVDAYRRAGEVLFEKFPQTQAADDERLYYAFHVLQAAGDYRAAARMYAAVPFDHADYFEAQRERLFALRQIHEEAEGEEAKADALQAVVDAAERLQTDAESAEGSGDRVETARRARGGARLALADVAATRGEIDEALALLDGFEQAFSAAPDLVRQALNQRIVTLIEAGQRAQQQAMEAAQDARQRELSQQAAQHMQSAVEQAQRMMADFPDEAAGVIDQVLTRLEREIHAQRRQAEDTVRRQAQQLRRSADQMADVASQLAETLMQWAEQQDIDAARMLQYRLIQARALRLAGEAQRAVALLEPQMQEFPNDASLISEYAEALYARGDQESLTQAARQYDKLIRGLREPYPDAWWNAWMRRLQINDQLGRATDDIPLRVRQLKRTDPNLGGSPYRETLEALHDRHAG